MAPGIGGTCLGKEQQDAHHGGAAAPKLDLQGGGLLGLAMASTAVALIVLRDPSRWLEEKAYLLALWGVFLAGVVEIIAAVCRRRAAAGKTKLTCCASVAAIIVVVVISSVSAAAA
ncbi:unnamed protein product [Urochloa humidicola]